MNEETQAAVTRVDVDDGKYTVVIDHTTGQMDCLRDGQPWRRRIHDSVFRMMALELEVTRDTLAEEIKRERK